MVDILPHMYKALRSVPSITKPNKNHRMMGAALGEDQSSVPIECFPVTWL